MLFPHDPALRRARLLAELPSADPRLLGRAEGHAAWIRLGEVPVALSVAARQIPGLARPEGEVSAAGEAMARLRTPALAVLQAHRLGDAESPGLEGRVLALRRSALREGVPARGGALEMGEAWSALMQTHAFALGCGAPESLPLDEEETEEAPLPEGRAPRTPSPQAPAPPRPAELEPVFRRLLKDPALADPSPLCGTEPEGRAALLPLPGSTSAVAFACADAAAWAASDPFWAAAHAVAAAARRVACVGAEPCAVAVSIALGPETDEGHHWALAQALAGLRQACLALELPVVALEAVPCPPEVKDAPWAAPCVAMVGLIEAHAGPVDVHAPEAKGLTAPGQRSCSRAWRAPFEGLFLLGEAQEGLGGARAAGLRGELPELRLDAELRLQHALREGIGLGLLRSARDLGAGGLMGAVTDASLASGMGAQLFLSGEDPAAALFGEAPGRVLVGASGEGESALCTLCATHRVPFAKVGVAGGGRLSVAFNGTPLFDVEGEEIRALRATALEPWLGS
jgi:hypothetical protein